MLEQIGEFAAQDRSLLKCIAEVLSKGTLAGTEKARHPDANALAWFTWSLGDGLEKSVVLFTNAVGGDVFRDLGIHRLLIRLIDLDDLLNLVGEITCEQVANRLNLGSVLFSHRF